MMMKFFATIALLALGSCSVREKTQDCGHWLEFAFDHNMEYADAFTEQVRSVEVRLFDMEGNMVLTTRGQSKRMMLTGVPAGHYTLVAAGNLSGEHFDFAEGVALRHNGVAASDFPHAFFCPAMDVELHGNGNTIRVPLRRQTNRFNIVLETSAPLETREDTMAEHTAQIAAPERGAYAMRNEPTDLRAMLYSPHTLTASVVDNRQITTAAINTMRLLPASGSYELAVRDVATGAPVWSTNLLPLLAATKPARRPDGSPLPLEEYLERQGQWNIIISYETSRAAAGTAFTALSISINGWVVWKTGMEGV